MTRIKSRALVAAFCAVAGGGLVPVWSGAWFPSEPPALPVSSAHAAEPPTVPSPVIAPGPAPAKTATEPAGAAPSATASSSFIDQVRRHFPPERAFDPLDLTPERIRILEQAFHLVMTLRARDAELSARERALDAVRHELDARMRIFETEVTAAREGYREAVRKELAERERAADAKLELVKQQEEALGRLKSQLRRDVGEQFDKIIGAYQSMKPKRAARVLEEKDPADVAAIMFLLPDDQRARILSEMDPALVGAVLKGPFAGDLEAARAARNGRAAPRP